MITFFAEFQDLYRVLQANFQLSSDFIWLTWDFRDSPVAQEPIFFHPKFVHQLALGFKTQTVKTVYFSQAKPLPASSFMKIVGRSMTTSHFPAAVALNGSAEYGRSSANLT